jgi:hypothetical protein
VIPPHLWPWKLIGRIALPVAVVALAWWQVTSYAERRADAREAEIRALWEADAAKRDKVAAEANAKAEADKAAQLAANAKEMDDARKELAAIAADRDTVDGLLRRARDQVRALAASAATGERGLDALAGIAARAAEVDRRLADYDAACRRDSVRFAALQEQIRGQL